MNQLPSALNYLPKIDQLPLILVGPILRQTQPDRVTVWFALQESRSLQLEVYATENQGNTIGQVILRGESKTVKLGQYLHLIAITAIPLGQARLKSDRLYAYNVYFDSDRYNLVDEVTQHHYSLSYFPHQLPTFALPPQDLNQLNIVHGSCRKPHGGGEDTLSFLDYLIADNAHLASVRPHQLFLTGDQIYGDDVADPILWLAQGIEQLLLGWSEELPLLEASISAEALIPGKRSKIAELEAGFTGMFHNQPEKAKSHLFSFGEYTAVYLLAWSPLLIPDRFPQGQECFRDRQKIRLWDQEIKDIASFVDSAGLVRRSLANIPVYTICDDHEISDDWYLNREWCERVLSKPLGRRTLQNGLLAYALFQAWGNTPEHFETGTGGANLLQLASDWSTSQGRDTTAKAKCDRYLGIPTLDPETGLPQFVPDADVLILARQPEAIPWYYTVRSTRHEVIVLDTRAWRGYPTGADQKLQPPMLLSPMAFERQLQQPLHQSPSDIEATFIVLPTNLVTLGIIDRIQEFELSRDRVFSNDVGDSWNFHGAAFAQLLLTICRQRQQVIIFSGDIHYSCAVRLTHRFTDSGQISAIVQLTSSAIKNSEPATRIIHTKLKSLLPEAPQHWLGWNHPFQLQAVKSKRGQLNQIQGDSSALIPDWQYHIEWYKRQPAQSLPWRRLHYPQNSTNQFWRNLLGNLLAWLWRNRWLQEGSEVVGRNNLSVVQLRWSHNKTVIQETYWRPPWNNSRTVKSRYEVPLTTNSQNDCF